MEVRGRCLHRKYRKRFLRRRLRRKRRGGLGGWLEVMRSLMGLWMGRPGLLRGGC